MLSKGARYIIGGHFRPTTDEQIRVRFVSRNLISEHPPQEDLDRANLDEILHDQISKLCRKQRRDVRVVFHHVGRLRVHPNLVQIVEHEVQIPNSPRSVANLGVRIFGCSRRKTRNRVNESRNQFDELFAVEIDPLNAGPIPYDVALVVGRADSPPRFFDESPEH